MTGVIADEPALITGLASAMLILAVAFGVPVTDDQRNAILGLVAAGLALGGSLIVRGRVTPNGRVDAAIKSAQTVPPDPTTTAVP